MADFTVAAQVKPPEYDPLATVGKIQGVQQGILNNRLLGMKAQGLQALGPIMSQNTDANGNVDYSGVVRDTAANPQTAFMTADVQQAQLANLQSEVAAQRAQLGLKGEQFDKIGAISKSMLGAKGADGKPVEWTADNAIAALASGAQDYGLLNDPKIATLLASKTQDLKGKDPVEVGNFLKQLAILGSPTAETIALVNGSPSVQNTGATQQAVQTSALTGTATKMGGDAAALSNTLTPGEEASPRGVVDAKGVTHAVPTSALVTPTGQPKTNVPGLTDANGATTTGLAPGVAEVATTTAHGNADQALALQQDASGANDRIGVLRNMQDAAKSFTQGTAAQQLYTLNAWNVQLSKLLGKEPPPQTADAAAAQEEFRKLSTVYAAQQGSALGLSGSDSRMNAAHEANPHEGMSGGGIANMLALNLGNEQARAGRYQAWQAYSKAHPNDPKAFGDFTTYWNQVYDPRAFQYLNMPAANQQAMKANMKPDELKKFNQALLLANAVVK